MPSSNYIIYTTRTTCAFLALLLAASCPLLGKQVFVSSDDDFKNLAVEPGDEIIWRDGTYIDQGINLNASGT